MTEPKDIMDENTKIIYFTGVHGAGKTTLVNELSEKLRGAGFLVKVMKEMDKPIEAPINTWDFQLAYAKQMKYRKFLVRWYANMRKYDFILVDRHPVDVYVYTNYLLSTNDYLMLNSASSKKSFRERMSLADDEYLVYVNRSVSKSVSGIEKRASGDTEYKEYRLQWDETNTEKIEFLQKEYTKYVKMIGDIYERVHSVFNGGKIEYAVNSVLTFIHTKVGW
jgi:thymidylate kinase